MELFPGRLVFMASRRMRLREMNAMMTTGNGRKVRVAMLALCMGAVGVAPMLAQQDTPPAGQEQGPPPGGPRGGGPERQMEMMTKELNLTPDQVTSIKAVEADARKQQMALREDTTTPQDQKREKMMALRTASQAKVRALLTEEQKPKFDAMEARMRERMQNRGGQDGGPGGPPPPPPGV